MHKPKPTVVLSGLSGNGKSKFLWICEHESKSGKVRTVRSFNKYLLEEKFYTKEPGYKFLSIFSYMQSFALLAYEDERMPEIIPVIERSAIDTYFYDKLVGANNVENNWDGFISLMKKYFNFITYEGKKELIIVDMWNFDRDWISRNLSESSQRLNVFKSVDEYLKVQAEYKDWFFKVLDSVGINYKKLKLEVNNLETDFSLEKEYKYIHDNILIYE